MMRDLRNLATAAALAAIVAGAVAAGLPKAVAQSSDQAQRLTESDIEKGIESNQKPQLATRSRGFGDSKAIADQQLMQLLLFIYFIFLFALCATIMNLLDFQQLHCIQI